MKSERLSLFFQGAQAIFLAEGISQQVINQKINKLLEVCNNELRDNYTVLLDVGSLSAYVRSNDNDKITVDKLKDIANEVTPVLLRVLGINLLQSQ